MMTIHQLADTIPQRANQARKVSGRRECHRDHGLILPPPYRRFCGTAAAPSG
jgi:hypothetical protein